MQYLSRRITEFAETQTAERAPAEAEIVETKPAETEPAGTESAETEAAEIEWCEALFFVFFAVCRSEGSLWLRETSRRNLNFS